MKTILSILLLFICGITYSQTTITGTVVDDSSQPLPGANIIVVGTSTGTVTDFDGNFTLNYDQNPPFSIQASSVGFESSIIEVTSNNQVISFILKEGTSLDEVIVSASRTPERIFESPVTVERFGIAEIKNTASADFYGGLESLKGVDINTNSLTFKAINTRGFASFANNRFMQLVDGMDNSAPALNFPLGNLVGMTETDVQSVELLPGAASALYGANAFNGILFMTSKNPFDHEGISGYYKQGITSQKAAGDNTYTDFGIRIGHKFSDKFAVKVNFSYLKGTDWVANNYTDKNDPSKTRANSLDYDGINTYGELVATNIRVASGDLGIIPDVVVSRTGYDEADLTDYNAESVKTDWGLYYRPWGNDFEIQYVGKYGTGSTIYQGSNRYAIEDFWMSQHKLEIRNDNFFVRGYITEDDAGDSYDMVFTAVNINRQWKDDTPWFEEYIGTYAAATLGGLTDAQAHLAARAAADTGRLIPGTTEFDAAFNKVITDPDILTGAKFQDNSKVYHADANYNFSHLTEFADIQVGGSYRTYELNSSGTIYTDYDGPIKYSEFGIYTQIQKEFELNENVDLKLTGSVRYDKAVDLFDGFFSPRLSAGFTINENHNIRASAQTGFRNPTTQDLYIGLNAGPIILIGGAPDNPARDIRPYDLSPNGEGIVGSGTIQLDGQGTYNNSYLLTSVGAFEATGNPALLEEANPDFVKPEKVSSFEVGYRGKLNKVIVDLSVYYNSYKDFIANQNVVVPFYGRAPNSKLNLTDQPTPEEIQLSVLALANGDAMAYQAYTNSDVNVNSYGGSIGVSTKILGGFDLGANYTYIAEDFDKDAYPDFRTNFNTPEHKVKATFGNTNLFENFGFNIAWRWNDNYFWQNSFADGPISAQNVIDAQINLKVPSLKSTFKAGATNLLGDEYTSATGTGFIGSMYYVSLTINNL
jgi:outer membrane receptor protein involved in Fe transport